MHRKVILYNRNPDLKLRYAFKSSTFFCGDDILMDPIGGSIPCNSFMPIKLILTSMRLPGVYEGELECVVEWENRNKKTRTSERALNMSEDAKSDYNFIGGEMEMLYLRVKKRIDLDVDSRYMEVQTSELPLF